MGSLLGVDQSAGGSSGKLLSGGHPVAHLSGLPASVEDAPVWETAQHAVTQQAVTQQALLHREQHWP